MRILAKLRLSSVLVMIAVLLFPEPVPAQAAQHFVQLDNSGCPANAALPFSAGLPDSVTAQTGSPINDSPDIVLLASVHADQVRFAAQPKIRVRLCWGGDSLRVVERTNLPSPVVAGTTYRDVFINLEILGYVNALCLTSRIMGGPADNGTGQSCAGLDVGVKR